MLTIPEIRRSPAVPSDTGVAELAACGVASTVPIATMVVRAPVSQERTIFRGTTRGRPAFIIILSFYFSIAQFRLIADDAPFLPTSLIGTVMFVT
ncbi:hypothetical protein FHR32_003621 [Streptosporangium album]|uniref:Uncharacterized protein n=1 Tax=Streptosporangium album TaxID=47479 RepID=A0A7W7W9V5_9ACTN|nr:hypothetical protein [Streptosporangium album]MBB4939316.1 hypothetical protein [Streptosporangium album]